MPSAVIRLGFSSQVALGKSKHAYDEAFDEAPKGYNSVIAPAYEYPDPQYDLTLPTGKQLIILSWVYYTEDNNGLG